MFEYDIGRKPWQIFHKLGRKRLKKRQCGSSIFKIFPKSLKDTPPPSEQKENIPRFPRGWPRHVRGKTMQGRGPNFFGWQKKSREGELLIRLRQKVPPADSN